METLTNIIIFVFGILHIILFFKIWRATNNIKKITKHFVMDISTENKITSNELFNNNNSEPMDISTLPDKIKKKIESQKSLLKNDEVLIFCVENSSVTIISKIEWLKWHNDPNYKYIYSA